MTGSRTIPILDEDRALVVYCSVCAAVCAIALCLFTVLDVMYNQRMAIGILKNILAFGGESCAMVGLMWNEKRRATRVLLIAAGILAAFLGIAWLTASIFHWLPG